MKNIKTYEGFLENKCILDYEDQIDSFLDDLKDISIGFYKNPIRLPDDSGYNYLNNPSHKTGSLSIPENIIYCFCIRDYDNKKKKYEVDIFLKEIKSACKSIGFNVYTNRDYYSDIKTGGQFNYIILDFCKKKSGMDFRKATTAWLVIGPLVSKLGIRTLFI